VEEDFEVAGADDISRAGGTLGDNFAAGGKSGAVEF